MKILYKISVIFCSLIIIIMIIMPFGGPKFIIRKFKNGQFYETTLLRWFRVQEITDTVTKINIAVAYIFFGSILICILSLLIPKRFEKIKQKIGIICLIFVLIIALMPKMMEIYYYIFG